MLIILGLLSICISISNGSALAQDVPTSVTIKPSLGLTVSSSDITLDLDPATKPFDNKSITINIGTNNPTGYSLTLNSTGTDLVNVNNSSETIPTLTEAISQASFPAGRWGYRLGTDTTANYLPYVSGTTIGSKGTITNNDTINLTIASKIDYMKDAGSYKLDLDLKALPHITQYYMQDLTSSQCTEEPTIVIDKRDEQIYTIRRIGNTGCWMVSNLRFKGIPTDSDGIMTLDSTTSNVASEYTPSNPRVVNYQDLTTGDADSWTIAKIHNSDDFVKGIWYNYVAATAGTIITGTDSAPSAYDICPKNWKLPTLEKYQSITSYVSQFNPEKIAMGNWFKGGLDNKSSTWWWSSTPKKTVNPNTGATTYYAHYAMQYSLNSNALSIGGNGNPQEGYPVRCLLSES